MKESGQHNKEDDGDKEAASQQNTFESVDNDQDKKSQNMKKGKNKEDDPGKLTLTAMNESASKKKRPFDYNE